MEDRPASSPGLYIHIPFCASVCPYCDFAVTLAGEDRRLEWARGLVDEASMYRGDLPGVDTIYLGGGTPSTLATDQLCRVLVGLKQELAPTEGAEIFLEVNPEDVDPDRARQWAAMGVRFVSVGVQSLNERALEFLGRGHDRNQALRAVALLIEAGIPTISVDLMFGLPGQTASDWKAQLESIAQLGIGHISCYQLTIHRGTVFGRRRQAGAIEEMPEHNQAELYLLTHEVLGDSGFEGYEVSNFARGGHRSRHNLKYWTGAPYLGLGPAAHSYDGRGKRWWNSRKLRLWQRQVDDGARPVAGSEVLKPVQSAFEAVMLGTRLANGVDLKRVEERWGVEVGASSWQALERFASKGLVVLDGWRVRPTPQGMAVADALARSIDLSLAPATDDSHDA